MVSICQIKVSLVTMANVPTYSYINIFQAHFEVSKCTSIYLSLLTPDTRLKSNAWSESPYIYNWNKWIHVFEKHISRESFILSLGPASVTP